MAITQTLTTEFKKELLNGTHDFTNDTFKIALYDDTASLDETTQTYTTTGEVTGTGYTAGGKTLSATNPTTASQTAFLDFDNVTWGSSTITATGALIYNSSKSNKAVAVLYFGGEKNSVNGDFTINFPAADADNAILRVS